MKAEVTNSGDWHRPRWARLALAAAVLMGAILLSWRQAHRRDVPVAPARAEPMPPPRLEPETPTKADTEREALPVSGYSRSVERPKPVQNPVPSSEDPGGEEAHPRGQSLIARKKPERTPLPEVLRMPGGGPAPAEAPLPAPAANPRPAHFAPFGRLLKCQLVETLDSVTARSEPIVALVTHDLDWNGETIIPAGTEAFGYARPEPVLDASGGGRLVDDGSWTLVMPAGPSGQENGRELVLRARAIDRSETTVDERAEATSWGPLDGADGLSGTAVSTLGDREIKLFAAAAVSGMAQGMAAVLERQQAAAGIAGALGATQAAPTLGNAALGSAGAGAVQAANEYAGTIRDEIRRRGVYVRVPAGKEFYLFVEQTIDPGTAQVGLHLPGRKVNP